MKRISFLFLFIFTQIFLIFFQIHKQSKIISLSYKNQKAEKQKIELIQRRQNLKQQIYFLQNPKTIKDFAINNGFEKIKINQIKNIKEEND